MDKTPDWAMPWLSAKGKIARAALAELDRPLRAWHTGCDFDPESFYSQFPTREIGSVERQVRDVGRRLEWRMECVWQPDGESSTAERETYEAGQLLITDRFVNPRCLDDYVTIAYSIAGHPDERPSDTSRATIAAGLEWATAGVCVLQQSLPWPFVDVLPYAELDNRPAHRLLYAYAELLAQTKPRSSQQCFRAMLFMNPTDNMGARYYLGSRAP